MPRVHEVGEIVLRLFPSSGGSIIRGIAADCCVFMVWECEKAESIPPEGAISFPQTDSKTNLGVLSLVADPDMGSSGDSDSFVSAVDFSIVSGESDQSELGVEAQGGTQGLTETSVQSSNTASTQTFRRAVSLRRLLVVPSTIRDGIVSSIELRSSAIPVDMKRPIVLPPNLTIFFDKSKAEVHVLLDPDSISLADAKVLASVFEQRFLRLETFRSSRELLVKFGIRKCDIRILVVGTQSPEQGPVPDDSVRRVVGKKIMSCTEPYDYDYQIIG
jgi:hypothetical protein